MGWIKGYDDTDHIQAEKGSQIIWTKGWLTKYVRETISQVDEAVCTLPKA